MFRKLVSNVSFSPALVGQLGFYARRLKKEEATRRLGLVFTALALVVQSFAVLNPPEPANAASDNDMVRGGIKSRSEAVAAYDRDKRFRNVMAMAGVSRSDIENGQVRYLNNLSNGTGSNVWRSYGYLPRFSASQGEIRHNAEGTIVYSRPHHLYNTTPSQKRNGMNIQVVYGTSSKTNKPFAIQFDCGNLWTPGVPTPPPPPPPPPPPAKYACSSLSRIKQDDPSKYVFRGKASAENGATITALTFDFGNGKNQRVNVQRTEGKYAFADTPHTYDEPGTYNVKVTAHISVGGKQVTATSENCQKPVTIPQQNPNVRIEKKVRASSGMTRDQALDQARNFRPTGNCTTVMTPAVHLETGATYTFTSGCLPSGWVRQDRAPSNAADVSSAQWVDETAVERNAPFQYRIVVKNTGDMPLQNAVVSDEADAGIELTASSTGRISEGRKWTHTISSLAPGASQTFTLTAKTSKFASNSVKYLDNKVCIDTPTIPGQPDDCDNAAVELPEEPIRVCELASDRIINIKPSEFDETIHSKNLEDCEKIQVCDLTTNTVITIRKPQYDSQKHTRDLTKCDDMQVCDLASGDVINIKRHEFDEAKHSEDAADCVTSVAEHKKAINLSQGGRDATEVLARSNDRIRYTITVTNRGLVDAKAEFVENLDDVLEYATLIDNGSGVFDGETKRLSWPDVTLSPGESQSRIFDVQLASTIPAGARGISEASSYDCVLTNTFGNSVDVKVDCPVVKSVETAVSELPKTGTTANLTFAGVLMAVVVYFYARSRQLKTEVRLIRRDLNTGTIH